MNLLEMKPGNSYYERKLPIKMILTLVTFLAIIVSSNASFVFISNYLDAYMSGKTLTLSCWFIALSIDLAKSLCIANLATEWFKYRSIDSIALPIFDFTF